MPVPQPSQGYHFPPAEPQPAYGYSNPQLLGPQQWPQHGEPQAQQINYQGYGDDQGPFQESYDDGDGEYGDEYYEDEGTRRGPRWLLIAAALIGAIGVGGALAYTYRSLVAPSSRVPVVQADPDAKIKVRPEEPGGRQFPGLSADAPVRIVESTATAASPEGPPSDSVGPRTVKTIPVAPAAEEPPGTTSPVVPGITLYQPPQAPGAAPAADPAPALPEKLASEPAAPAVSEPAATTPTDAPLAPEPPGAGEPSQQAEIGSPPPAATSQEEPTAAPPPVREPVRTAAVAPPPPPAQAEPESPGLGYVAVLFTKKSSMDALKTFADLQQKYSHVLGDRAPKVQKADLSARGLGWMYRVMVGPPGSREAARSVCSELKSAGYVGCWIKRY